jgi:hypothetical protein
MALTTGFSVRVPILVLSLSLLFATPAAAAQLDPAIIGVFIPIVALVVGGAVLIFAPLARAHARRLDRRGPEIPSQVSARLERIERSIEAIALEVERISEGQRFVTKLLAERPAAPAQLGPASAVGSANPAVTSALPPGEQRS